MNPSAFSSEELDLLASVGRTLRFEAGSFLWHEDDAARYLFVIRSGRVRIIQSRDDRQHLVHVSGPGETIGEVPLFDGGGYPASAVAATETECLVVDRKEILALLPGHPELTFKLLARLSRRVRHLVGRLRHQTIGTVRSRLAASLLGASSIAQSTVVEMGTQAAWAEDIGTVRESLAREISALRKEGILERVGRNRYRILNEGRLEKEAARPA